MPPPLQELVDAALTDAGGLGDLDVGAPGCLGGLDGEVALFGHGFECLCGAFHVLKGESLGVGHVVSVHGYMTGLGMNGGSCVGACLSLLGPVHLYMYRAQPERNTEMNATITAKVQKLVDRFVINIAKRNDSRLGPTCDRYDAAAERAFEQLVRLVGETEALRLLQD